ncbi:MAG: SCO family protein [Rhodospirillales bacterium]|nr:SCO family protein [Rhodospirillales bacterium]
MRRITGWLVAVLMAAPSLLGGGASLAHDATAAADIDRTAFCETAALETSQAVVGRAVGDYAFTDSYGRHARLATYQGKPLVVSLVYTSCADFCPTISKAVGDAVEAAVSAFGRDAFAVVTIGFDSRADTPSRMRAFAASHGLKAPNWSFLSADANTILGLSRDLGFTFFSSAKGFDHLAQTTLIDPEGRVYRQIYGTDFAPPSLVEPMKELIFKRRSELTSVAGLVNRVRLFCTIYDPASGRYRFDYSLFITLIIGTLSLGAVAAVMVRAWWRSRRLHGGA